jgi:hypothetical protein
VIQLIKHTGECDHPDDDTLPIRALEQVPA